MTILLTGGTGFIGSNLFESLRKDFSVLAPTHAQLNLLDRDSVSAYIKKHAVDTIIHTAATAGPALFESNIRMFLSLADNHHLVKRIIHCGSGAEYDKTNDLVRVSERTFGKRIPADSYGLAKYVISQLADGIPNILIFRIFGMYGPHEDYRKKFISNTIVKHLFGMPILIKQDVRFDYLYIDDFVSIVRYALTHRMSHRVYNLTPDRSITLSEIAAIINALSPSVPVRILTPGMNFEYTGNNARLRTDLPKFRFHTHEEGIRKLYTYYKAHKKILDIETVRKDNYLKLAKVHI